MENIGRFELEWKTIELNGFPDNSWKHGFNTPFIDCIVSACNPESPQGAIIEKCRWNTKLNEWHKPDIMQNWMLHPPYQITHYIDNMPTPFKFK